MREPPQQFVAAVMVDDRLGDHARRAASCGRRAISARGRHAAEDRRCLLVVPCCDYSAADGVKERFPGGGGFGEIKNAGCEATGALGTKA